MDASLLEIVGQTVAARPWIALLAAAGVPILLVALVELFRPRATPPEESATEERQALAPPVPVPEPGASFDAVTESFEALETPPPPPVAAEFQPEPVAPPAPAPEPTPETEPTPAPEPVRLRDRLRGTRAALVGRLGQIVGGRTLDAELLDELELVLFGADLGVRTAESLLETVRRDAAGKDADTVRQVLRDAVLEKVRPVEPATPFALAAKPHVILVLGVNGSGKTTTIGKLAARHAAAGRKVILGAGDTFRAAASEQLQAWGARVGCEVIVGPGGGDPSAVAFDTVKAATARGADVAIIDTAGRLQTKKPLMEELGKLARVIGRACEGAPHETLLVLDSNTGQNALSQAELFTDVTAVTGLVLTKLDGTAKGGVLVGLADAFRIPVPYVGIGEAIEDLRDFHAEEFVDALFSE